MTAPAARGHAPAVATGSRRSGRSSSERQDRRDGESREEQLDRNYGELLQELRVAQTGTQILFAFLLTVAFSPAFGDEPDDVHTVYAVTLVLCAVATALLGEPSILVLDEPANGLDPSGMAWLRGLLRAHAHAGGTVLISSLLLSELELLIDDVVIIAGGSVRLNAPLAAIAGALVMALVGSVRLFAVNRRVRKLEKERERIKSTLR